MDNNEGIAQDEPSLPPYTEKDDRTKSGYPRQPGYPAQSGCTQKEGYPVQQPYTAQPGYPGPAQPGYPLQTYPPVQGQQTSTTVVMQPTSTVILPAAPHRPPSWLALSIFSFLCCFWSLGLVAIIFSSRVDTSYAARDYEGARKNSRNARNVNIVAIIGVLIIIVIVIVRIETVANQIN